MQKRENKAIFLRISGEMAKKTKEYAADSKTQREYAGLRAPQAPPPGLQPGLHCKTTFCFSVSPAGNTVTPNIPRQPAIIFRHPSSFLQSKSQPSNIQQPPFRRQPGQYTPPPIFLYRYSHNFPSSNTQQQPAGETCRLPIHFPLHFFSFDFCKYFSFFKTPQFLAAPLFYGYYFKTTFNIILLKGVSFSFNISIGVHCFSCQLYSSGILSPTL